LLSKLFKYTVFAYLTSLIFKLMKYLRLFIFEIGEWYLKDLEGSRCGPLLAPFQNSKEENSREFPQEFFFHGERPKVHVLIEEQGFGITDLSCIGKVSACQF